MANATTRNISKNIKGGLALRGLIVRKTSLVVCSRPRRRLYGCLLLTPLLKGQYYYTLSPRNCNYQLNSSHTPHIMTNNQKRPTKTSSILSSVLIPYLVSFISCLDRIRPNPESNSPAEIQSITR